MKSSLKIIFVVLAFSFFSVLGSEEKKDIELKSDNDFKVVDKIVNFHPWGQKDLNFSFVITLVYKIHENKPIVEIRRIGPYGDSQSKNKESFYIKHIFSDEKISKAFVPKDSKIEIKNEMDFSQTQVNETLVYKDNKITFHFYIRTYFLIHLNDPKLSVPFNEYHDFFVIKGCQIDINTKGKE